MNDPNNNVIEWKPRKNAPQQKPPINNSHPPLINLPPVTKYLAATLIIIHVILWTGSEILNLFNADIVFYHLGFISARIMDFSQIIPWGVASLITFTFLHGGWMHLFINVATLAAFGTGTEKFFGAKRMLIIFFASSLIAAFAHFVASPDSLNPIVGASGGVSGLFGAILLVLKYQGQLHQTNNRILPIVIVFVLISILFGYLGAPDGSPVAWIAHIGGFLGGLAIADRVIKSGR